MNMKISGNGYLEKIINYKKSEIRKEFMSLSSECMKSMCSDAGPARDFRSALIKDDEIAIIAEFKRMSPSKGLINSDVAPEIKCRQYELGGADAISILTDEKFFGGHICHIENVRESTNLPVLRKDFIISEIQIYESKIKGADAILLIARILSKEKLSKFIKICRQIGIYALVEAHNEAEIKDSLKAGADIMGINNRNLGDFSVDISITERLINKIPEGIVKVSESGIQNRDDILRLHNIGVDAVLIGELLMTSDDVKAKIKELKGLSC